MPVVKITPKFLKPYISYGVDLRYDSDSTQAQADCPFCGREGKFAVAVETGQWRCLVCATGSEKGGGNLYTFIRELWKMGRGATNGETSVLARERGLMFPETLTQWEAVVSPLTGQWLVPGYGVKGDVNTLYQYRPNGNGKRVLMLAPETHHAIFGVNLYDKKKSEVWLQEGYWNAAALWELMRTCKDSDGDIMLSGEPSSMLSDVNILGVPGANVFSDGWASLLSGKNVTICFDSDHPPTAANGKKAEGAGWVGMKRVCNILSSSERPPESVRVVRWGENGFDPNIKSGFDVRDMLVSRGLNVGDRMRALRELLDKVETMPSTWVTGRSKSAKAAGKVEVTPLPCTEWSTMVNSWRKAMAWSPPGQGLDYALSVMLASVASTDIAGSQLWIRVMSPPSTGKTVLAEAISVAKKYVKAVSSITGFHSGHKTDVKGEEDHALVAKLRGKTLVTKDGDTLMTSDNLSKILAEARDLYDRVSRVHFKNGIHRENENLNITWLLLGTGSLHSLDQSELGERFLSCEIMKEIDHDEEDDVGMRVAMRTLRAAQSISTSSDGSDAEMTEARRLTAGYVEHLRQNAQQLSAEVDTSNMEAIRRVRALAKFVAYMRAKPSLSQTKKTERELSYRLIEQLLRLALCLAMVLNKRSLHDPDVMRRVQKVAMDSSMGDSLNICKFLHERGQGGAEVKSIAVQVIETEHKVRDTMRFLQKIHVAEHYDWTDPKATGVSVSGGKRKRWRLTPRLEKLYTEVNS